jgi:hypothetical protein
MTSKSFLAIGQVKDNQNKDFIIGKDIQPENISLNCGDTDGDKNNEILISIKKDNGYDLEVFNIDGILTNNYENIFKDKEKKLLILAGDTDADGQDEIIKIPNFSNSFIEIFKNGEKIKKFRAFNDIKIKLSGAIGDINNDGQDEIIIGAGKGGGPQVKIFNGKGNELTSFFVFNPSLRNGINVEVENIDEDRNKEVIVSQKNGGEGIIKIYKVDNLRTFFSTFLAYPKTIKTGAKILAGDLNNDNEAEIITMKDIENDNIEMKIFDSKGNIQDLDIIELSHITSKSKFDICEFKNKKAIVFTTQDNGNAKVNIIYN